MRGKFGRLNFGRGQYLARPPTIYYRYDKHGHLAKNCRFNIDELLYKNSTEYFNATLVVEYAYYYHYNPWYMDSGAIGYIALEPSKFKQRSSSIFRLLKLEPGEENPTKFS